MIAMPKTPHVVNDNTVSTIIRGEGGGNGPATAIRSGGNGGCPNKVTQKDWDAYQERKRSEGFTHEEFGACVEVVPDGQENAYLNRTVIGGAEDVHISAGGYAGGGAEQTP